MSEAAVSVHKHVSRVVIGRAKEFAVRAARQGSPEQIRNALGMLYKHSDSVCYRVSQPAVQQVNPVSAMLTVEQHRSQMGHANNLERQMARSVGLEIGRDVHREVQEYTIESVNQSACSNIWYGICDIVSSDRRVSAVRARVVGALVVLADDASK